MESALFLIVGLAIIAYTVVSAVKTFVLPRSAPDRITRIVFTLVRKALTVWLPSSAPYSRRDRLLAFYAPFSLLALLVAWLALIALGYTLMFRATGSQTWGQAFQLSGSSLLTLGFAKGDTQIQSLLSFTAATLGLILVALLIAYLPTMYSAFSRREAAVTLLEVRAGNPPSAVEMIKRYNRIHGLSTLHEQWQSWEAWFADIQESHTSLAALVFFRSPLPQHHWVTAAGAVLDAASLTLSVIDIPDDPQAALCIRAGYLSLRHISSFFAIPYDPDPHFPANPIHISRQEFDAAVDELAGSGVPVKPDREQAWSDFAGWRVNYDFVLCALAGLTTAPSAPWSGDRPIFPPRSPADKY